MHHEPVTTVCKTVNINALPNGPSRDAYLKHRTLLNEWDTVVHIPEGTPRPLGTPPLSRGWSDKAVRQGFKSDTGLTPNMFEWIIETAIVEAVETPHLYNTINCAEAETTDQFGRTIQGDQFNMLFNYTSGEEHGYQVVDFCFEKKRKM
eukprot:5214897-Amphidinium_carterae.1